MKKMIIALMLMTAIESCKKSDSETAIEKAIKGNWELRSSFCGIGTFRNYAVGNGAIISFKSDRHFTSTGTFSDTGVYRITTNAGTPNQPATLLLEGSRKLEFRITVSKDSLRLDVVFVTPDGCWYNYQKLP